MTVQRGFEFHFDRCTGCGACVVACLNENQRHRLPGHETAKRRNGETATGQAEFTTEAQRTQRSRRDVQSDHRTSNSEPKSEVRSPMSANPERNHEPHEIHEQVFNPQSAIRNPQLTEQSEVRGPDPPVAVSPFRRFADSSLNWRQVVTFNERRHPGLPSFHLSLACHHCGDPACLAQCPAGAYRKDPATGAVLLDPDRCIGCKYCAWACPYDAPRYDPAAGVMTKCTFCADRLAAGREPACVAVCPTGALSLADLDPGAEAPRAPGFTATAIHPAIRFTGSRNAGPPPELTAPADRAAVDAVFDRTFPRLPAKISLRTEWSLVVFTSVAALLVAWLGAFLARAVPLDPRIFLGAGAAAMALSALHLGRKGRAWRAVLNPRRSWLSLEILAFSLFLGLAALRLLAFPGGRLLGVAATAAGFAALIIIDRVYQVALQQGRINFHSAQVLFTGLFLTGVLTGRAWLYVPVGAAKLILYLYRKGAALDAAPAGTGSAGRSAPWIPAAWAVACLRVGLGFGLPLGLVLGAGGVPAPGPALAAVIAILAGEWIDRCEFYAELDVITPRRQMQRDLEAAWRGNSPQRH